MRKRIFAVILTTILMMILFGGCSTMKSKIDVELTDKQEAQIDVLVQHRDEWKETTEYISTFTVNRVHVSEMSDGIVVLTVAYMETGTGAMEGSWTWVGVRGYAVKDNVFYEIGRNHHMDWFASCMTVDLENMSDEELREVLRQSFINYLQKQPKE